MNSIASFQYLKYFLLLFILSTSSSRLLNAQGYSNGSKKFTPPEKMSSHDWSDQKEIRRTWDAALVRIPINEKMIEVKMSHLDKNRIPPGKKFPTVIYLHGCSGVWKGTYSRINFLAKNGFAVIAPLSFARNKYPKSCDPDNHQGGMYRPTLKMRQHDAGFAIRQAKKLRWVDSKNVFLMGLSQGGITTATFQSDDLASAVNARIVEGWTCHAGWKEYQGINAPQTEPVLTLVAEQDPWFQQKWNKGDCGQFLNKTNGSRSILFKAGRLRNRHELLEDKQVQQFVLKFLRKHLVKHDHIQIKQ